MRYDLDDLDGIESMKRTAVASARRFRSVCHVESNGRRQASASAAGRRAADPASKTLIEMLGVAEMTWWK